jgi:uncharacterized membrane protein
MNDSNARARCRDGITGKNRVEAFSDGVLAIVITILVLELKAPDLVAPSDRELWLAILHMLPEIWAWVVSFLFVLVFWVSHHYFFAELRGTDRGLLWLNGLFLLAVSFTPFPTGLVGRYPSSGTAVCLLSVAMLLTASAFSAMRWYVATSHGLSEAPAPARRLAFRRGLIGPAAYTVAVILSFVWTPGALIIQAIVPVVFFLRGPSRASTPAVT